MMLLPIIKSIKKKVNWAEKSGTKYFYYEYLSRPLDKLGMNIDHIKFVFAF